MDGTIAGIGVAADYAACVPKPAKPERPAPSGESDFDRYVREHPLLQPDTDNGLGEGETELTFIASKPDADE